jgi:predicted nucleic acid-binding protein
MIVSNTSPIINLACIGQLDLLPALFGTMAIPPAVFAEITVAMPDAPVAAAIRAAP